MGWVLDGHGEPVGWLWEDHGHMQRDKCSHGRGAMSHTVVLSPHMSLHRAEVTSNSLMAPQEGSPGGVMGPLIPRAPLGR